MTNPQCLAGLTAEEIEFYNIVCLLVEDHGNVAMKKQDYKKVKSTLESLSRSRALLKKHEWIYDDAGDLYCCECFGYKKMGGHKPDCAIAAELAGTEGE